MHAYMLQQSSFSHLAALYAADMGSIRTSLRFLLQMKLLLG